MDNQRSKGILYMLLSSLSFAVMGVCVKAAGPIPLVQKVFFRNLIMVFLIAIALWGKGKSAYLGHKGSRLFLLFRSLAGLTGVLFYFYSIKYLNLGDSSMLNRLSPFFVTLFAVTILKAPLKSYQIPALCVAFAGALLIIKPQWDLDILPALAGTAAAVAAGLAYTLISYLKGKEAPNTVIFWFSGISTLAVLPFTLVNWITPDLHQLLALAGIGIFASGGQFFLTRAYHLAPAAEVSIYNYSHILFSLILGWSLFGEVPDLFSLVGALLIVGVAVFLFKAGKAGFVVRPMESRD